MFGSVYVLFSLSFLVQLELKNGRGASCSRFYQVLLEARKVREKKTRTYIPLYFEMLSQGYR